MSLACSHGILPLCRPNDNVHHWLADAASQIISTAASWELWRANPAVSFNGLENVTQYGDSMPKILKNKNKYQVRVSGVCVSHTHITGVMVLADLALLGLAQTTAYFSLRWYFQDAELLKDASARLGQCADRLQRAGHRAMAKAAAIAHEIGDRGAHWAMGGVVEHESFRTERLETMDASGPGDVLLPPALRMHVHADLMRRVLWLFLDPSAKDDSLDVRSQGCSALLATDAVDLLK